MTLEIDRRVLDRIVILGTTGSGKSTLARRLSEILGHPHVERVFAQLLSRTLRRVWNRDVFLNGNRETLLGTFFSKESILRWAIESHPRHARDYRKVFDSEAGDLKKFEFRRPGQTEAFVQEIGSDV